MKLLFKSGPRAGEERQIERGQAVVLGRDLDCDVALDDTNVSRRHARLRVDATGTATIEDLNSTNGTLVNGRRIQGITTLHDGDSVGLGNTRLVFAGDSPVADNKQTVVASPARSSRTGLTTIRASLAQANRRSRIAVGFAAVILVVVVVAIAASYFTRPATIDEVVARLRPSVLLIESRTQYGGGGSGTGWVLDATRGLLVTNNHVISGGQNVTVSGEGLTARTANIVAAAPCDDLAVLHVDDKAGLTSLPLGSQANLHQGDEVLAIGYPGTDSPLRNLVVTTGTVAVVKTTYNTGKSIEIPKIPNVVQATARINHGNSGGPLVTRKGELIGVNSYGNLLTDENYAIGVDRVKEVVATLVDGHGIAWTGMSFTFLDPATRSQTLLALGLPDEPGLLVIEVEPGTKAADAGFGTSPILITAIDGHPMDGSAATYCDAVGGKLNGSSSTFSLAFADAQGAVQRQDLQLPFQ